MGRNSFALGAFLGLILIGSLSMGAVDNEVVEALEEQEEVPVIVMLNDEGITQPQRDTIRPLSASQPLSKRDVEENKLSQRRAIVKEQQERVFSSLRAQEKRTLFTNSGHFEAEDPGLQKNNGLFKLKHTYSVINGFSGNITREGLELLRDNPRVAGIYFDKTLYLQLDGSVPQINANDVHAFQPNGTNLTGVGQVVCVIDSGIDYRNRYLGNCTPTNFTQRRCQTVIHVHDYENDDIDPRDDHGHGTHVAGIIASNDTTYRGVAPDAKLVALKVCDNTTNGVCLTANVIAGLDWCVNNKTALNITIITMSIGTDATNTSACNTNAMANSSNFAVSNGIFVSIAAGNNGCTNGCNNSISAPACGENVTAVASATGGDAISSFSNRATFNTIFAPGDSIMSTVPFDQATIHSSTTGFKSLSGTSMAAPHAAAAAALLLQFNTSLAPLEIKSLLNRTGALINENGNAYYRIDILAAIRNIDTKPPVFEYNATNASDPKRTDVAYFNITANDTVGLSYFFFATNDSGTFKNFTNGTLSGNVGFIRVNFTINATRTNVVSWVYYANDTKNSWNISDTFSFTVANSLPTVGTPAFNDSGVSDIEDIMANATYDDNDIQNGTVLFQWYVNGTNVFNATFSNVISWTVLLSNLSEKNFSLGAQVNVSVFANDSLDISSTVFSPTLTISNNAPTAPSLQDR